MNALRFAFSTLIVLLANHSLACEDLIVEGACFDRGSATQADVDACVAKGDMDAILSQYHNYKSGGFGVAPNPAKAIEYLKLAIEHGCDDAKLVLADAYVTGDGVPPSIAKASALYSEAATNGSPEANCSMGALYHSGQHPDGVDLVKAIQHTKLAADAGHPRCTFVISLYYYNGDGTARNLEQSRYYMDKAVDMGFPDALEYRRQMFGE